MVALSTRRAPRIIGLILALSALGRPALASDIEENLARLRAMSRDDRARLAKKLDEFAALERPERDAVRAFDARIADLPRNDRARYLAILHRYSMFYQNLPPDQQKALDAEADPTRKLALIKKLRDEQKPSPESRNAYADAIQVSSLAPLRLRALAHQLIVYFLLDPKTDSKARAEFARLKDLNARREFVKQAVEARKIQFRGKFRVEQADFQEADKLVRNEPEIQKEIKRVLRDRANEVERERQRLSDEAKKMKRKAAQMPTAEDAAWSLVRKGRREKQAFFEKADEIEVFKVVEGHTVSPENLNRFEASLPSWARESLDPLPPEAAKRRLKILYRLVFPLGQEMPVQVVEPEPPKPAPKRAAEAPEGNASPF